jgi:hypothetical protein
MAKANSTRSTSTARAPKGETINQAAIGRADLLSAFSAVMRQASESRDLLGNIPCKRVGQVLADQLDDKLEALYDEIAALREQVETAGVVGEVMPEWVSNNEATKSRIPAQFMEEVDRRARKLAAAQYNTIRAIIIDGVASNMACSDNLSHTEGYVMGYIENYANHASDVAVVNVRDLEMLVFQTTSAINETAKAIAAVRSLERRTGMTLSPRIGKTSIPSHARLVEEVIDRISDNVVDMAHETIREGGAA